jgi:chemotaxis protein methyltransferase CheR
MTAGDHLFIRTLVFEQAAIQLEPGREYVVESRVNALAKREGIADADAFTNQLRSAPRGPLLRKLLDAMTTNETSFFRDLHPFESLRESIIPELLKARRSEGRLHIWCGAASSGQEPYSVLMLLNEHFPEIANWDFKFLATDLSFQILNKARLGRYTQFEVNRGLPASLLVKYFTRQNGEWEVAPKLRRQVEFRELNLIQDWPTMPQMDLVMLRNVLIYFEPAVKRQILERIRRVLRPGGYLILGGTETTFGIDHGFERVVVGRTTVYRNR